MTDTIKQILASDFPPLLSEIPDAPTTLYTQGTLPSPDMKLLTVVGSRACTGYGRDVVEHLIGGLRGYDISIVSGLALGIDAAAHKAAMEAQLHTVAVPGSGLDASALYPRAHVPLARAILEAGGALLSEYEPTQRAAPWTFPQRNRIMVGLAHAVLLIEAAPKSGTLITARLASEYNRELMVVPGSIFAATSKGAHQFLKLGATPVTTPEDVLEALGIEPLAKGDAEPLVLSTNEQQIYDALREPLSKDALLAQLSLPTSEVQVLLSKLELAGVITERMGVLRRVC